MDQLCGMGVPDPLCLFWGGVSLRGVSSWILGGFVIAGTLAPSILGPRHISVVVCLTLCPGENTRLPVGVGTGVGVNAGGLGAGWKSGGATGTGTQFIRRSVGRETFCWTPCCPWRSPGRGVRVN